LTLASSSGASEFEFVGRQRVFDYQEYLFEVDSYCRADDLLYLAHLKVWTFSPSIFKRMLTEWREFRSAATVPIFAIGETDNGLWEKFVTKMGFTFDRYVTCENGERRRMFRSLSVYLTKHQDHVLR
jgi:hypothetical protein